MYGFGGRIDRVFGIRNDKDLIITEMKSEDDRVVYSFFYKDDSDCYKVYIPNDKKNLRYTERIKLLKEDYNIILKKYGFLID